MIAPPMRVRLARRSGSTVGTIWWHPVATGRERHVARIQASTAAASTANVLARRGISQRVGRPQGTCPLPANLRRFFGNRVTAWYGALPACARRFESICEGRAAPRVGDCCLLPSEDNFNQLEVTPLTRRNLDGHVYRRSRVVEVQIAAALALSPEQLVARACVRDRSAPEYLQEETLAALLRAAHRAKRDELASRLATELYERSADTVGGRLTTLRRDRREDAMQGVFLELFELLVEPEGSDRGDFLQVRFGVVLKRLAIAAFQQQVKQIRLSQDCDVLGPGGPDVDDGAENGFAEVADSADSPDELLLKREEMQKIREGLQQLKEPYRTAFVLRYYYDWPVEDADPTVPTISRYFGKTSRTIRNWFTEAERVLQEWRKEKRS
jgi:DNA-directed RNA polymerase specialized sigma24 family protein